MKFDEKMIKMVVCIGLVMMFGLAMFSCGRNGISEQEVKQEEIVEQEEQEVIEDENLNEEIRNGEYQLEDNSDSDVRLIEALAEENLGKNGYDYKVFKQDNMIVLQIKLDSNTLASGQYNMSSWNTLVDTMVRLSGSASGVTSCSFVVSVTDYSDNCYITAMDGVLYIDVLNGINKLN